MCQLGDAAAASNLLQSCTGAHVEFACLMKKNVNSRGQVNDKVNVRYRT